MPATVIGDWRIDSAPPGGGWEPDDVAGLQVWHKTDTLSQADNSAVTSWPDSSGNSRTASQANGSEQPTYQTNEINGKAIVRGDGTDDNLEWASAIALTGDYTIWIVAKIRLLNANQTYFGHTTSGNGLVRVQESTDNSMDFVATDGGAAESVPVHSAMDVGTYYTIAWIRTGTTLQRYTNGVADGDPVTDATGTMTLNQMFRRQDLDAAQIDTPEFGIYNNDLSGTDLSDLFDYLQTKYNHY